MKRKTLKRILLTVTINCLFVFLFTSTAKAEHFVFVHGSWHGAWCWYEVTAVLEKAGHDVTAIDLPAHGINQSPAGTVTLNDYQQHVVNLLDSLSDPVVLVGHSMAGVVISVVAEARPLKVKKLVYLAAFLLQNGQSMFDIASQDVNSLAVQNLIIDTTANVARIDSNVIKETFYGGSKASYRYLALSLIRDDPLIPILTGITITNTNFGSVPRYYIETTQDRAISLSIQQMMYTAMPCQDVYTIISDHSPFFSEPNILSNYLIDIANK